MTKSLVEKYILITESDRKKLLEFNAEDLVLNKGLDQTNIQNKSEVVQSSVGILSWDEEYNIMKFLTSSYSRPMKHTTSIFFNDMESLKKLIKTNKLNISDAVLLRSQIQKILRSDIKVHCTCESFQFYRSYQLTQLDASIVPEDRPPKRNDPKLKRSHLCHHLLSTIRYLMKFEQHIIEYILKKDKLFTKSFQQKGVDVDDAITKQLTNLIDTWSGQIADILNDPNIQKELSDGIKNILNKRNLKLEKRIIKEQVDMNKMIANIDKFIKYITDNFVDKNDRIVVSNEMKSFIEDVVNDEEQEQTQQIENEPIKQKEAGLMTVPENFIRKKLSLLNKKGKW